MNTQQGLSLDKIVSMSSEDNLKSIGAVAFAQDPMDNSLLCIQQTDGGETVINYDVDDNSITEDMKMNYAQYIENIREQLLSSKLVYEEELGLCEVGDGK